MRQINAPEIIQNYIDIPKQSHDNTIQNNICQQLKIIYKK